MAPSNDITTTHTSPAATTGSSPSAESLRRQTQEAGRDVAHKVQQVGEDIAERAQQLGEQGRELASEYYRQGRQQAAVWERELEQQIREKPMQSLLIAGGVGLLLGLLFRR